MHRTSATFVLSVQPKVFIFQGKWNSVVFAVSQKGLSEATPPTTSDKISNHSRKKCSLHYVEHDDLEKTYRALQDSYFEIKN